MGDGPSPQVARYHVSQGKVAVGLGKLILEEGTGTPGLVKRGGHLGGGGTARKKQKNFSQEGSGP